MANHQYFILFIKFLILHACLLLPNAYYTEGNGNFDFHTIHINTLIPDHSVCKPSTGSRKGPSTMKVFHRYGPCSPLRQVRTPSLSQILSQDESRVRSIQAKLNSDSNADNKAKLPAQSGLLLETLNYIVRVSLGTPQKALSLAFDTGSYLTWTQCQPCAAGSCYSQQDPIFDPSKSTSYSNIACDSPQCSEFSSGRGNTRCIGTQCSYGVVYGDGSASVGLFNKDTLTLTPSDAVPNFLFGCGQNTTVGFGKTAGILGLGRDPVSIVSQTVQKYGKYFSYCLPSTPASTGFLTLGKDTESTSSVKFTPFGSAHGPSFYSVDIVGISVGGSQLPIDQSVFKTPGNIIDSGAVITRLAPAAYSALSKAFQEAMKQYPRASRTTLLDTCYDFSNFTEITLPNISFTFDGNVVVELRGLQVLSVHSRMQVCLAFAANRDDSEVGIFGNTQQKTLEVVYDVAGGNLGFGPGGCN